MHSNNHADALHRVLTRGRLVCAEPCRQHALHALPGFAPLFLPICSHRIFLAVWNRASTGTWTCRQTSCAGAMSMSCNTWRVAANMLPATSCWGRSRWHGTGKRASAVCLPRCRPRGAHRPIRSWRRQPCKVSLSARPLAVSSRNLPACCKQTKPMVTTRSLMCWSNSRPPSTRPVDAAGPTCSSANTWRWRHVAALAPLTCGGDTTAAPAAIRPGSRRK